MAEMSMEQALRLWARKRMLEKQKVAAERSAHNPAMRERAAALAQEIRAAKDPTVDPTSGWSRATERGKRFWAGLNALDEREQVGLDDLDPEMTMAYLRRFVDRGIPARMTREGGEVIDPMDILGRRRPVVSALPAETTGAARPAGASGPVGYKVVSPDDPGWIRWIMEKLADDEGYVYFPGSDG
jgi:hypothetical protein